MIEHRKSRRFDLKLPLTLLRCSGNILEQSCETANISSNGVLFHSASGIEVGSVLEYMVTLVPAIGDTRKSVQLHCLGKVVRQADKDTVAATLERYEFVRAD